MKKSILLVTMFSAVAILGTALIGAPNEKPVSSKNNVTAKAKTCDATSRCKNCLKNECCQGSCGQGGKIESVEQSAGKSSSGGPGKGRGRMMGHGHAHDSQHQKDHDDFFFLIEHRDSIHRTVKNLANGVETLTESDVDEVSEMIQVHVEAMHGRLENSNPIRMRDPIFRAVFTNANKIKMEIEHTDHGVRVTETSNDEYAVKLIQEHAKVVSLWIKNGYSELPKNHAAPKR